MYIRSVQAFINIEHFAIKMSSSISHNCPVCGGRVKRDASYCDGEECRFNSKYWFNRQNVVNPHRICLQNSVGTQIFIERLKDIKISKDDEDNWYVKFPIIWRVDDETLWRFKDVKKVSSRAVPIPKKQVKKFLDDFCS